MSKIHFAHILIISEALNSVLEVGFYGDKVIERTLKSNPKTGSNDRGIYFLNIKNEKVSFTKKLILTE